MTIRKILHVCVDYAGGQLTFDDCDEPLLSSAGTIGLHELGELFTDPDAWLDYDTEVEWRPNEDLEPWQVEERPVRKARGRLFGRGVAQVLTVFEDES